ncbi:dUTPase [Venenivibrio stagnispumantis]|uniref:dUTPase n=1 Tax=Venenivibrio stagnispumantis TaxID=407998 RepID=A0AA45WQE1_9AQUI|nr:dUTP diphosphatase [Venenivibrio stagnispumantis]MCW4574079.1 dUTP diphosphatase [Venenivibrio stagnispumantis]SMP24796.1 dUTPase [Venenivibrio stagnispumantis]
MIKEIQECLELQDKLNKRINENWREIRKSEDFYRAIWLESAEAVESLPWKWWKKVEPNWDNVNIEIVDIWHFILSLVLKENVEVDNFYKGLNEDFKDSNIDGYLANKYFELKYTENLDKSHLIIFLFERVAEYALREDIKSVLFWFGVLVKNSITFEKLFNLYIGKNLLNHLRQELGYKDGSYKKVINGMEDNEYLMKLLEETKDIRLVEEKLRKILKEE